MFKSLASSRIYLLVKFPATGFMQPRCHSSHTDGNYCTSPYRGLKRFCVNDYSVTIDKQHQNILPFILQCDFCYFHYIVF